MIHRNREFHIDKSNIKKVCFIILIIYILILFTITVFRFQFHYDTRQINITLLIGYIQIYREFGIGEFLWLFIGNIVWFMPFGFLLPVLSAKYNLFFIILSGFLLSFVIESLQFVLYKGVAELDDLVLNTLGAAFGYIFFQFANCQRGRQWFRLKIK